jgi:sporulation protein YqfD
MIKWHNLFDITVIEFTCADPIAILQLLSAKEFHIHHIVRIDEFTVKLQISSRQLDHIEKILSTRAENYRVIHKPLIYQVSALLFRRSILLSGMVFLLVLSLYLPTRVLFIQVEGNNVIPTKMIIEEANDCGIHFGASRKNVRSEKVKNALISCIPQLEWVGVNTRGCVAVISVREGAEKVATESEYPVGNIVAARDGIILNCIALRGTPVCNIGQAVTKGQLLISGYTDCGNYVQATCAEGEILAQTQRELTAVTPLRNHVRQYSVSKKRLYKLIIGNWQINLYKGSGISDTTCAKIYKENILRLPGRFNLPIRLISEDYIFFHAVESETESPWLAESIRQYLKNHMVAGTIISENVEIIEAGELVFLSGQYDCTEMIGQVKFEESTNAYGYDGENR